MLRTAIALLSWAGLLLQYGLLVHRAGAGRLLAATLEFASYFTIVTNLLVAVTTTAIIAAPASRLGRWSARADVRTATTLYILLVGVIYFVVLRPLWSPTGLQALADALLHYATPLLMLADWLLRVPRASLRYGNAPAWLAYPIAFGLYTFLLAQVTNRYPYPFVDVTVLGWPRVVVNLALLLAICLAAGLALVAINRRRPEP